MMCNLDGRRLKPIKRKRSGRARRGPANIPVDEWRNPKYLRFLRVHGYCIACCPLTWASVGAVSRADAPCADGGDCDPCHGPTNGIGSKGADSEAMPLCRTHHIAQHACGWTTFQMAYQFDRAEVAAAWWKTFKDKSAVPW